MNKKEYSNLIKRLNRIQNELMQIDLEMSEQEVHPAVCIATHQAFQAIGKPIVLLDVEYLREYSMDKVDRDKALAILDKEL